MTGNGKRALRAGFNRFQAAATTTSASFYYPAAATGITATPAWRPSNLDPNPDVARGEIACADLPSPNTTPDCEINFANVPKNFGVISLASPDPNLKRPYYDQYTVGVTCVVNW